MNKRQARRFALASTGVAIVVFAALTIDSHRQFPRLTREENLTPQVIAGKQVWHKYNCINCHTLFGEGAYYAPDLTKIAQLRGDPYLKAYMRDPSQFYDEARHRRLMPRQDLSSQEIDDLIEFLKWIANVDNQGWPPRPILVSGAALPGTDHALAPTAAAAGVPGEAAVPPGARPVTADSNPIALGQTLFRASPPGCFACHSVAPGVNLAGPSVAGLAGRAEKLIGSPEYKGQATDVAGYIRESIVAPDAHLVAGAQYSANGQSFMPHNYAQELEPAQIEQLVAYLATLR